MTDLNPIPLAENETIRKTVSTKKAKSLVSDGNSRWVEKDGTLYFVTTDKYKAPSVEA